MPSDNDIFITRQPWSDEYPASPQLGEEVSALAVAPRPARSDNGPTVALLGSYFLLAPHAERFGGRVRGAVRILAINVATGQVFHQHATRMGSVPYRLEQAGMGALTTGNETSGHFSTSGNFNIDLCEQLCLSGGEARYSVFAWLGDLVSPPVLVRVPANPGRPASPPMPSQGGEDLRFRATVQTPKGIKGGIALTGRSRGDHTGDAPRLDLFGIADPMILDPDRAPFPGMTEQLIVLVKWAQHHNISIVSAPLPEGRRDPVAFEVDIAPLFPRGESLRSAFAIAWLGGVLSPVTLVPPAVTGESWPGRGDR